VVAFVFSMNPQGKIAALALNEVLPMNPADILTPKQLAERLQVKPTWVYEMCRRAAGYRERPMPCMRIGKLAIDRPCGFTSSFKERYGFILFH
jgi:hypothetical protein